MKNVVDDNASGSAPARLVGFCANESILGSHFFANMVAARLFCEISIDSYAVLSGRFCDDVKLCLVVTLMKHVVDENGCGKVSFYAGSVNLISSFPGPALR